MRSKENREKQAVEKSWKDQPERDGPGESVVATHSCYVQSEMLNEANARYIFTEVRASKDKFPSPFKDLVPDPKSQ